MTVEPKEIENERSNKIECAKISAEEEVAVKETKAAVENKGKESKKAIEKETNKLELCNEGEAVDKEEVVGGVKRRYIDGLPDLGPMPCLGIPHWCYTMDTKICDYLEGTEYTVRDHVEGKVDRNGRWIKR